MLEDPPAVLKCFISEILDKVRYNPIFVFGLILDRYLISKSDQDSPCCNSAFLFVLWHMWLFHLCVFDPNKEVFVQNIILGNIQ